MRWWSEWWLQGGWQCQCSSNGNVEYKDDVNFCVRTQEALKLKLKQQSAREEGICQVIIIVIVIIIIIMMMTILIHMMTLKMVVDFIYDNVESNNMENKSWWWYMTKTPPYIPPPPLPKTHHLGLIAHTTLANHSLVVVIPFKVTPGTTVVLPDNDYDDNLQSCKHKVLHGAKL